MEKPNKLIAFIVLILVGWVFTLGVTSTIVTLVQTKYSTTQQKLDSVSTVNKNLTIENNGLWNLIKLKDSQEVGHYSHTEIKHSFHVLNKK